MIEQRSGGKAEAPLLDDPRNLGRAEKCLDSLQENKGARLHGAKSQRANHERRHCIFIGKKEITAHLQPPAPPKASRLEEFRPTRNLLDFLLHQTLDNGRHVFVEPFLQHGPGHVLNELLNGSSRAIGDGLFDRGRAECFR